MKWNSFIALGLGVLLFCQVKVYGQSDGIAIETRTIRLTFKEKGTGVPIKRVEIKAGSDLYYSDRNGVADLPLNPGQLQFKIYRAGFSQLTLKREDFPETDSQDIFLYPEIKLNQVLVKGKEREAISKKSVPIEEAREVAPRGDVAQIAKLLPGVQTAGFRSDIVVRGSAPEDSAYYVDGIAIPFMFHTIGDLSILPKKLVSGISFLSGGFGVSYGEVTGGIIVLETSKEIPTRNKTKFTLNLPIYSGIYHERALSDHEALTVSVRKSSLESIVPKVSKENLIVPSFYDSHLRYLQTNEQGYNQLMVLSSLDTLKLVIGGLTDSEDEGTQAFSIRTYFGAIGFEREMRLSEGWSYLAKPNLVFSHIQNQFDSSYVDVKSQRYKLPIEMKKRLAKRRDIRFGLEFVYDIAEIGVFAPRINGDDPFTDFEDAPIVRTDAKYAGAAGAAWSSIDFDLGPILSTPGIRVFNSAGGKKIGFDPRLLLSYEYSDESRIKLAIGQYSKAPEPAELDKDFGNPELDYEKSLHYVLALKQGWGANWSSEYQFYYKANKDVVRSDPILRYDNSAKLRSQGAELFLRRNLTDRWFGWLSYTWSKTEEKSSDSTWLPAKYDQTEVVSLVGAYKASAQWSLGGQAKYHTGDRYTPVNDAVFNSGLNKYQPRYLPEDRYKDRLPNWFQLDLYTSIDQLNDESKMTYRFGVEFIAPREPAFGVRYNYDYSSKTFLEGLPPIPYIEISGEF